MKVFNKTKAYLYIFNTLIVAISTFFALQFGGTAITICLGFILLGAINAALLEVMYDISDGKTSANYTDVTKVALLCFFCISHCFWLLLLGPAAKFATVAEAVLYVGYLMCNMSNSETTTNKDEVQLTSPFPSAQLSPEGLGTQQFPAPSAPLDPCFVHVAVAGSVVEI